jgi:hypothetical protein
MRRSVNQLDRDKARNEWAAIHRARSLVKCLEDEVLSKGFNHACKVDSRNRSSLQIGWPYLSSTRARGGAVGVRPDEHVFRLVVEHVGWPPTVAPSGTRQFELQRFPVVMGRMKLGEVGPCCTTPHDRRLPAAAAAAFSRSKCGPQSARPRPYKGQGRALKSRQLLGNEP